MNKRIILVVGDKFANYAQGKDAITVSQLRGLLSLPEQLLPAHDCTVLLPGQGLGEQCVAELLDEAAHSANVQRFDFSLWRNLPKRAPQSISHKHQLKNTLISKPRQISENTYELHLLIDENSELMTDHQSGQHVQGMILIEAARQSTVAITETFYLKDRGIDYAFVLNDMAVKYNNFSFPVPASIVCRIVEKSIDNPRRLSFAIEAEVVQCNTCVSSLKFSIAAMDKQRISRQEDIQAHKAQKRHLAFIHKSADEPTALLSQAH